MPRALGLSEIEQLRRRRVLENLEQLKKLTTITPEKEDVIKVIYGIKDKEVKSVKPRHSLGLRKRPPNKQEPKQPTQIPSKKVKKPNAKSIEFSDDENDWPSSGEEWTPNLLLVSKKKKDTFQEVGPTGKKKLSSSGPLATKQTANRGLVMELATSEAARRYPVREKPRPNYSVTTTIPEDDRFLYCYECDSSHLDGCLIHPVEWVENKPLSVCEEAKGRDVEFQREKCVCGIAYYLHTARTAPRDWIYIYKSGIPGAGFGVWTNREIKRGTTFGPYAGKVVYLDEMREEELVRRSRGGYAWLVRQNLQGMKSHLVDARNPLQSNWLRFVNCARFDEEQNLVTIQYRGKIYYRACQGKNC
ncbi:putative histone-lysine N-methyltransferase prdm7 [Clonorchis sinensis]|uniref:Histone-lysine N-methyltransferase prdm7 n=2 Tax=Clonorchis sinensis TaxID=79923 RepID=A0A8T1N2Z2_CLOSI|nr:putative histone-lysine N-methyltransferase prdm7 [Clonorchis sinensis]